MSKPSMSSFLALSAGRAPWTPVQVARLNEFQHDDEFHAFTCRNRDPETPDRGEGDFGILVATTQGWVCRDCDYTQDWV